MVGPLVDDLAKLHASELRAESEMDRLAAQVPPAKRTAWPRLEFPRLFPPLSPNRGSAASNA